MFIFQSISKSSTSTGNYPTNRSPLSNDDQHAPQNNPYNRRKPRHRLQRSRSTRPARAPYNPDVSLLVPRPRRHNDDTRNSPQHHAVEADRALSGPDVGRVHRLAHQRTQDHDAAHRHSHQQRRHRRGARFEPADARGLPPHLRHERLRHRGAHHGRPAVAARVALAGPPHRLRVVGAGVAGARDGHVESVSSRRCVYGVSIQ